MNLEVLKAVDEEADWYAQIRLCRWERISGSRRRKHAVGRRQLLRLHRRITCDKTGYKYYIDNYERRQGLEILPPNWKGAERSNCFQGL